MVVSRNGALHFGKYVIAGGITFACEYTTFLVLYYAVGLPVVVANIGAFALSLVVNFLLNRQWVFQHGSRAARQQALLFVLLASFNLLVTTSVLLAMKHYGFNVALGKLMIMSVIVLWNFTLMRRVIFNRLPV